MADERYRDIDAALRAAVALPSADELGLLTPPVALGEHPTLSAKERIGRGGMGVVFRAYDRTLDCDVAVKLLRPGLHDAQATRRLVREGRALLSLRHPRIVALHRIEQHAERVLLVMELVSGVSLSRWLACAPRTFAAVQRVLRDCGEALAAAHRQGLVHRDFKPANVMVRDDDSGCVLDFGLARRLQSERPSSEPHASESFVTLTAPGTLLGTAGYIAPELQRGERGDARSDQYSFAVTAWEALQTSGTRDACPPALIAALTRAQAADPSQRHPDMQDLLVALHA